ncbi:hypothetical protein C8R47DRAFT_1078592 [Mycena vitilis]|nr:hypothetical protein C8R47DRAFT_1078592 [Mycena vitilis]
MSNCGGADLGYAPVSSWNILDALTTTLGNGQRAESKPERRVRVQSGAYPHHIFALEDIEKPSTPEDSETVGILLSNRCGRLRVKSDSGGIIDQDFAVESICKPGPYTPRFEPARLASGLGDWELGERTKKDGLVSGRRKTRYPAQLRPSAGVCMFVCVNSARLRVFLCLFLPQPPDLRYCAPDVLLEDVRNMRAHGDLPP